MPSASKCMLKSSELKTAYNLYYIFNKFMANLILKNSTKAFGKEASEDSTEK